MTISDAIMQLQSVKPHQYGNATIISWLSRLDDLIYRDVMQNYNDAPMPPTVPYTEHDMDLELLVAEPHTDIYIKYLCAQVDFFNAEFERYNNSMTMYNVALDNYAAWFGRNHMPIQPAVIRF